MEPEPMKTGRQNHRFFAGWKTIGKIAAGGTGVTMVAAMYDYIANWLPEEADEHYEYERFGFDPFVAEVQIWTIVWSNVIPLQNSEFVADLLRADYMLDRHMETRHVICMPKVRDPDYLTCIKPVVFWFVE